MTVAAALIAVTSVSSPSGSSVQAEAEKLKLFAQAHERYSRAFISVSPSYSVEYISVVISLRTFLYASKYAEYEKSISTVRSSPVSSAALRNSVLVMHTLPVTRQLSVTPSAIASPETGILRMSEIYVFGADGSSPAAL